MREPEKLRKKVQSESEREKIWNCHNVCVYSKDNEQILVNHFGFMLPQKEVCKKGYPKRCVN